MRIVILLILVSTLACSSKQQPRETKTPLMNAEHLIAVLDTIYQTEQTPIRLRDSLMKVYGVESAEADVQQKIYRENHVINEQKVKDILQKHGWPGEEVIGEQGALTICNVLQHSDNEVRKHYLPMMRQAVLDEKLQPRFLARAEDRLATDEGKLQIYGGQIKYYPASKTFNVWPIIDPANVDKRRAEIGLEPMASFLASRRFPLEWNLEEQLKRTAAFKQGINE